MTLDFDDLPPLEEYCGCYNGQLFPSGEDPIPCRGCNKQTGMRPTEFGEAILQLIRDHKLPEGE